MKELEDDAEAERQKKLAKTKDQESEPVAGSSKVLDPQQQGGAKEDGTSVPPVEPRGSARLNGGLAAATDAYVRKLGIAVGYIDTVGLEDLDQCLEASERLTEAYVNLQAHLKVQAMLGSKILPSGQLDMDRRRNG
jgi:hypothetical protein